MVIFVDLMYPCEMIIHSAPHFIIKILHSYLRTIGESLWIKGFPSESCYYEYFQFVVDFEERFSECQYLCHFVINIIQCVLNNLLDLLENIFESEEDDRIIELSKSWQFLISSINSRHLGLTLNYLCQFIEAFIESNKTGQIVASLYVVESLVFVGEKKKSHQS